MNGEDVANRPATSRHWEGWWDESPPSPPARVRVAIRWPLAGGVFLVPFVVPAVRYALTNDAPVLWRAVLLALLTVYAAGYLLYPVFVFHHAIGVRLAFCGALLALGWALLAFFGLGNVYALIYALAVIAFGLPPGWVLVLDGGSLAVLAVLLRLTDEFAADASDLGTVLGVTTALFFVGRLVRTVRRLRDAQAEIAALAVAAERERLARDLHDLLGHSLTTIIVKAGLARRLLQTAGAVERATTEIGEVEQLSRTALADVRATVSQYRTVSLPAELAGARAALRAAEIDADLPNAVDDVRSDLRDVFGYVLREAVTNVLRHSAASHVTVRLGRTWLEVDDDGRGGPSGAYGNGLRGLAERLSAIGGTLAAGSRPGGGFRVRAVVE